METGSLNNFLNTHDDYSVGTEVKDNTPRSNVDWSERLPMDTQGSKGAPANRVLKLEDPLPSLVPPLSETVENVDSYGRNVENKVGAFGDLVVGDVKDKKDLVTGCAIDINTFRSNLSKHAKAESSMEKNKKSTRRRWPALETDDLFEDLGFDQLDPKPPLKKMIAPSEKKFENQDTENSQAEEVGHFRNYLGVPGIGFPSGSRTGHSRTARAPAPPFHSNPSSRIDWAAKYLKS
ncbi:unnamed protein product [Heterobilharzia americana]|nr:unnamed protein product [Heterobilharzia americana]